MKRDNVKIISHQSFVKILEILTLAGFAVLVEGKVIGTQYHILSRYSDRLSVGRLQEVAGSEHKQSCLSLRLGTKRYVNSHLIAVKVSVECRTYQRVQFNCASFHENRLKRLNSKAVKRRSAVQHYGMPFDNGFKSVPHRSFASLNHFTCAFDILSLARLSKALHDKRLEKLKRHFFRKSALIHFEFRTDDDNRTSGVIDTLAQKVLTEASLLAFKHFRERFKRAVVWTCNRSASASVINKCVNRFLKHSLFIAYNYFRSAKFKESFKSVIAVDNLAIKIV